MTEALSLKEGLRAICDEVKGGSGGASLGRIQQYFADLGHV